MASTHRISALLIVAGTTALLAGLPAHATLVEAAVSITAEIAPNPPIPTGGDMQSAATGAVLATAGVGESGVSGLAIQADTGVSHAAVEGIMANGATLNRATATATFEQEFTNTSGADQAYEIDISLTDMFVELDGDSGGAAPTPNPFDQPSEAIGAFIDFRLDVNGTEVFAAHFEAFGGNGSYSVGAGAVFAVASTTTSDFFNAGNGVHYAMADLLQTISLGTFGDGETLVVRSVAQAHLIGDGGENYAAAGIGDPNNVSVSGILVGTPPIVMPTPVPMGLAVIAIAAIGWRRRAFSP